MKIVKMQLENVFENLHEGFLLLATLTLIELLIFF